MSIENKQYCGFRDFKNQVITHLKFEMVQQRLGAHEVWKCYRFSMLQNNFYFSSSDIFFEKFGILPPVPDLRGKRPCSYTQINECCTTEFD